MAVFISNCASRGTKLALLLAGLTAQSAWASANPWFPLRVGNSWTYACSVDGEPQDGKTLRIVGASSVAGTTWYRAELKVVGAGKPLVTYYGRAASGDVWRAMAPGAAERDPAVPASPVAGAAFGEWRVGGFDQVTVPALPRGVRAVRIESFDFDEPVFTEQQRMEWLGRDYAQGIGPIREADGLGGDCVLTRYRIAPAPRRKK